MAEPYVLRRRCLAGSLEDFNAVVSEFAAVPALVSVAGENRWWAEEFFGQLFLADL